LGVVCALSDARQSLMMLYLALGAFVGTSLALAFDVWAGNRIPAVPTALAVVGVGLMLGSCVHLVREALTALRSNHLEVCFYRDLQARRSGAGPSPCP
jgi:H+/Cl- antiporter ClcA